VLPDDLCPGKLYFFDLLAYGPGGIRMVEGTEPWAAAKYTAFHGKPAMYIGPDEDWANMYDFLFEDRVIHLTTETVRFNLVSHHPYRHDQPQQQDEQSPACK